MCVDRAGKKEIIDAESALQTLPEMELVLEGLQRWYDNAYGVFKEISETLLENPAVEKWFDIKAEKWEVWGEYGYAVFLGHHMGVMWVTALRLENSIRDNITAFELDHIPLDERTIPEIVDVSPVSPEIIPPDLAAFFSGFDSDGNRAIDLGRPKLSFTG